jgi:Tfp pilus assembly PilM family ATPase
MMRANLSIEIGRSWLKLAVGRSKGKISSFFNCTAKDISSLSEGEVASLISQILKQWKIKPKSAVVSIPRNLVTLRNLHLPSQDKDEISQIIELHIGRIVPYPREDILCGHSFSGLDEVGYARVVLGILHRDIVNRQIKILERANLYIDKFILSSYGIWRDIVSNQASKVDPDQLYLALDIDSDFTDFIIFSKEEFLFSRSITMEAKKLFLEEDIVTKLIGELRQSLVIFQNEEINKRPAKIFLSGAGSNIPRLAKTLNTELEIEVEIISSPYLKIPKEHRQDIPEDISLSSVVDLLRERDEKRLFFVIPELEIKKQLRERTRELVGLGSLCIYILTVFCGIFVARIYNQNNYLNKLKEEIRTVELEVKDLEKKWAKIRFVKDYIERRKLPLFLLYKLEEILPEEIAINFINLNEKNRVTIKGEAYQLSNVFSFVSILEGVENFKEVETKSTRKRRLRDREVTEFEIVFNLEK